MLFPLLSGHLGKIYLGFQDSKAMEGLEERLQIALDDFVRSKLYRPTGFRFFPWMAYGGGITITPVITGLLKSFVEIQGITPANGEEYGTFPFQVAAAGYFSASLAHELTYRRSLGGENPRLGVMAEATAIGSAVALSGYALTDSAIMESSVAGSLAFFLSKIAGDHYHEGEQAAPLKNKSLASRVWHNLWFAYPQATALAAGVASALFAPGIIGSDSKEIQERIYDAVMAGSAFYAARGIAGGILRNFGAEYLANRRSYTQPDELDTYLNEIEKLKPSRPNNVLVYAARGELSLRRGNFIGALQNFERASFVAESPFAQADSYKIFAKKKHHSVIDAIRDDLSSGSLEKMIDGLKREITARRFEIAELYADALSTMTGQSGQSIEGIHSLLLSITRRYDEVPAKLESYVRAIIPSLEETAQTESVSESRHNVWRVNGVVPGYLRQMETKERAETEYRNALFFYDYFKGRMPEPLPPIEIGDQVYIFSRAFGEGNLLDKIRRGNAMPQDIIDSVNLLIEIQNAAAPRRDLPDPLSDQGYLMRRFDTTFLEPLRRNGVEISAGQEAVLREALYLLEPSILALPRGVYRDLNPKNIVEGPAGTKVPIDWEELVRYPIQKDAYKLLIFGDFYLPSGLYDEMVKEIIIGTHESVAPSMSFQEYREDFRRGLHLMGPAIHLDMAGYAAKDQASSANEYARRWNRDAQRFHLIFSSWIFNDLCTLANEIGIDQTSLFFDASDALTEIVETNYPGGLTYAPHIPDRRRPFFRSLFQKEQRY